mmetsp:Transcript_29720/g.76807  ORF Transcript_29720/g.76807 Transcript_29720/m.76807 type:complete len:211 (+) Transcript_29720:3-635(+)
MLKNVVDNGGKKNPGRGPRRAALRHRPIQESTRLDSRRWSNCATALDATAATYAGAKPRACCTSKSCPSGVACVPLSRSNRVPAGYLAHRMAAISSLSSMESSSNLTSSVLGTQYDSRTRVRLSAGVGVKSSTPSPTSCSTVRTCCSTGSSESAVYLSTNGASPPHSGNGIASLTEPALPSICCCSCVATGRSASSTPGMGMASLTCLLL